MVSGTPLKLKSPGFGPELIIVQPKYVVLFQFHCCGSFQLPIIHLLLGGVGIDSSQRKEVIGLLTSNCPFMHRSVT